MKTDSTSQIQQIADLFEDFKPRTADMVANELQLKNSNVSVHLCALLHKWMWFEVVKIDTCPITGNKVAYYNTIIWTKKEGVVHE